MKLTKKIILDDDCMYTTICYVDNNGLRQGEANFYDDKGIHFATQYYIDDDIRIGEKIITKEDYKNHLINKRFEQ